MVCKHLGWASTYVIGFHTFVNSEFCNCFRVQSETNLKRTETKNWKIWQGIWKKFITLKVKEKSWIYSEAKAYFLKIGRSKAGRTPNTSFVMFIAPHISWILFTFALFFFFLKYICVLFKHVLNKIHLIRKNNELL